MDNRRMPTRFCMVIIILVVVAIIVIAVVYSVLQSFHGTGPEVPAIMIFTEDIDYGTKCVLSTPSKAITWSDITIQLTNGSKHVSWSPKSDALDSGYGTVSELFKSAMLGSNLRVWCNVTDVQGNGYINGGDYFTFTTGSWQTFSPDFVYTVSIVWLGYLMQSTSFSG